MIKSMLYKKKSFKSLFLHVKRLGGRNSSGRIVSFHRGGGIRWRRLVDYKRLLWNVPGYIIRVEYDPSLDNLLALVAFVNGVVCYILCPQGVGVGSKIINGSTLPGSSISLVNLPIGYFFHNLELKFLEGAKYLRSLGSYGRLMSYELDGVVIKLKSGSFIKVDYANIVSCGLLHVNLLFKCVRHKKAGFWRLKGWRPVVRGVAMNPVDHPHGGGEGKSSGGRPSVSKWGWLTKNKKCVV